MVGRFPDRSRDALKVFGSGDLCRGAVERLSGQVCAVFAWAPIEVFVPDLKPCDRAVRAVYAQLKEQAQLAFDL
jgi:hypothetical protein